ncbi:MAG: sigma-70 family RNA polymerase sigma factor [Sulfitobacter sp.]
MAVKNTMPAALTLLLPRLRVRARRLTSCAADADDLMQDATLKLWQLVESDKEISDLDRYAMTLIHNLARQRWRSARSMDELTDDIAQTEPTALTRLDCLDALGAIEDLPADQAALMHLICQGETSPAAIARRTGLPVGTVMSRLARARARLRAVL